MSAVITAIFSQDKKEILLVKRRDVPVWVLPGGGIEEHEMPINAAKREAEEESGFNVSITRLIGEYFPINRLSKHTYLFSGVVVSGQAKINSEAQEIRFFEISKLPDMPPPYKNWIFEALEDRPIIIQRKIKEVNYKELFKNLILHPILVFRFILSKMGLHFNA